MSRAGRVETCVGFSILAVLAGILAAVLALQSRYDPAVFKALEANGRTESGPPAAALPDAARKYAGSVPEGIAVLGGGETFNSETLSDKIDGKAELYLSSGFLGLATQRFSRVNDSKSWFELFIYDMGDATNAFSVYSRQKRKDAVESDVGAFSYATENALYAVSGRKYIEIVAAETSLGDEMHSLAQSIAREQPAEASGGAAEFDLFPAESLEKDSISLLMSDVFGCSGLNNVYTARYRSGNDEVIAFISRRGSPEEASAVAAEYRRFLVENGGTELGEAPGVSGLKLFQVFDAFEAVLQSGIYFAGTHEVDSRDAAVEIAARIYRKLEGAAK